MMVKEEHVGPKKYKDIAFRLGRYFLSGLATFIIDVAILFVLIEWFKVYYLFAAGVAFVIAITMNYFVNRKWTFTETKTHLAHAYLAFMAVAVLGLCLTILFLAFLVEILHFHYITARIMAAIFIGLWTFILNSLLTFKVF